MSASNLLDRSALLLICIRSSDQLCLNLPDVDSQEVHLDFARDDRSPALAGYPFGLLAAEGRLLNETS